MDSYGTPIWFWDRNYPFSQIPWGIYGCWWRELNIKPVKPRKLCCTCSRGYSHSHGQWAWSVLGRVYQLCQRAGCEHKLPGDLNMNLPDWSSTVVVPSLLLVMSPNMASNSANRFLWWCVKYLLSNNSVNNRSIMSTYHIIWYSYVVSLFGSDAMGSKELFDILLGQTRGSSWWSWWQQYYLEMVKQCTITCKWLNSLRPSDAYMHR